jgi:hypothetical protein
MRDETKNQKRYELGRKEDTAIALVIELMPSHATARTSPPSKVGSSSGPTHVHHKVIWQIL